MIKIEHLSKQFTSGNLVVEALSDINLTIEDGDIFGIIGMSGAGKSTLVRCINMLERPSEGTVNVNGKDMGSLSEKELRLARRDITMIFQAFNLLKQRTCLKNICFPMELEGVPKADAEKRAIRACAKHGFVYNVDWRFSKTPFEMRSGRNPNGID